MSDKKVIKPVAFAVGAALASTFALGSSIGSANTVESPFAISTLSAGYLLGEEGSCGGDKKKEEGSCGGDKEGEGSCGEDKHGEGSCGEDKDGEGSCGEGKDGEGSCGEDKDAEGSCGEGSCGGDNT
jgi:uncharacterized low-complexity protein